MDEDRGVSVILATFENLQRAQQFLRDLILRHFIAGGNIIGPSHTFYLNGDAICEAEEYLVIMRTVNARCAAIAEIAARTNIADVELTVLEANQLSNEYLTWMREATTARDETSVSSS